MPGALESGPRSLTPQRVFEKEAEAMPATIYSLWDIPAPSPSPASHLQVMGVSIPALEQETPKVQREQICLKSYSSASAQPWELGAGAMPNPGYSVVGEGMGTFTQKARAGRSAQARLGRPGQQERVVE